MQKLFLILLLIAISFTVSFAGEDKFATKTSGLSSPAYSAFSITPSDSNEFTVWTRGVYVGVGGDITLDTGDGSTVTFVAVPTGVILPIRTKVIYNSTTAASLLGLY